jgi:ectoine hydroxylase-related dioxygenase (phytanoyl-CoA dioxygenase family)
VRQEIVERGFAVAPAVFSEAACSELINHVATVADGRVRGGVRLRIAGNPALERAATQSALSQIASGILGRAAFPARAIYFDKTAEANWKVAWHQDLTIAVRERVDVDGFGPWSAKDRIPHVQPPVDILERMVSLRVHLDDCSRANGPLRVIPRSHQAGRLSSQDIAVIRSNGVEHICVARAGDVIAMRPLLLHASSVATEPGHRRVLHVEYAADILPGGLEWFERCA